MKTTTLLFALILGCIITTYSQINRNRKTDAGSKQSSVNQNKKNDLFGNYKFVDKFGGSLGDRTWNSLATPIGPTQSKNREEIYSGNNMPCFKPAGIFSMRVYKPDSTATYTMLLKKY